MSCSYSGNSGSKWNKLVTFINWNLIQTNGVHINGVILKTEICFSLYKRSLIYAHMYICLTFIENFTLNFPTAYMLKKNY